MKTQLILLLLTTSSLVRSSPVVFIVYKKQNSPPTLLSSGIIATEKYIITTKTSIAAYVTPELCVMPAINMEMMKESYKEKFCNDIQRTFFPRCRRLRSVETGPRHSILLQSGRRDDPVDQIDGETL
jgi:hypothetical protein